MKKSSVIPRLSKNKIIYYLKLVLIVLVISNLSLGINVVSAHVLKTDGNIGAVMHVNPDDDPIAGLDSSFYFEFKDKSGKFDPAKCDCNAVILENGKELFKTAIFAQSASLTSSSFTFNFPEKNVYQLKVIGTANDNSFQNFTLNYDIRVAKDASNETNKIISNESIIIIGGIIALIALIIFVVVQLIRRKAKSKI